MRIKENPLKFLLIVLACVFNGHAVWAQDSEINSFQNIRSPQTHDLGSAVFSQVSMFTGKPSIGLPIYTIKHFGLEVPISLSYDASGMIPNKAPGVVGLNWSLSAGGVITRNVNNIPDETLSNTGAAGFKDGFFGKTDIFTNAQVTNVESHTSSSNGGYYFHDYELAPDMFVFNFGKHSGQFMMDHTNTFRVQSDRTYRIDENLMRYSTGSGYNPLSDTSNIIIIDSDGVRYDFGGSFSSIEHSHPGVVTGPGNPNAWYLTKITSPEGHTIEFKYAGDSGVPGLISTNSDFTVIQTIDGGSNLIRAAYLRSIICKTKTGTVTQSVVLNSATNASSFSSYFNEHLESIDIKDHDGVVKKKFEFTYDYKAFTGGSRIFLRTFGEAGLPKYAFEYNDETGLSLGHDPGLIDYWGFYNAQTKTTIGPQSYDSELTMLSTYAPSEPSFANTKIGILNKITSPTKGVTEYFYELNQYSITYTLSDVIPGWRSIPLSANYDAGGLRIRKIEMSDGTLMQKREYTYLLNYTPSSAGRSSGVITRRPAAFRYNLNTPPTLSSVGEQHMYYSEVVEKFEDGGYKIHKFTSGDFPDKTFASDNTEPYKMIPASGYNFASDVVMNFYKKRSSAALERGKPSLVTNYNSAGKPIMSTTYTYNRDANRYNNNKIVSIDVPFIGGLVSDVMGQGINHLLTTSEFYYFNTQLTRQEDTWYDAVTSLPTLSTTTNFDYNGNRQVMRKTMVNSEGTEEIEKYKYAGDYTFSGSSSNALKLMKDLHIISPVVEKQKLQRASGGAATLLEGDLTTFRRWNSMNIFRPDTIRRITLLSPATDTIMSTVASDILTRHSSYSSTPEIIFDSYTTDGNVEQFRVKGVSPAVTYIWSYAGQHPVAEIRNATHSQVETAVGSVTLASLKTSLAPNISSLSSSLRTGLPGAMISTYVFVPLVGMTSSTDAKGLTTTYDYDDLERLQAIRDYNGHIVKTYDYNYKQ